MSSNRIIEKAIYSFAMKGYDGTSISNIAELVGIKKSTIYSHFKSKDEIFENAVKVSFETELDFVKDYFSKDYDSALGALENFLIILKNRFVSDDNYTVNFVYKMGYSIIEKYDSLIKQNGYNYYYTMEDIIINYLVDSGIKEQKSKKIAMTYTTILDGIMVSLIYCGEKRYEQRKQEVWKFFSESFL